MKKNVNFALRSWRSKNSSHFNTNFHVDVLFVRVFRPGTKSHVGCSRASAQDDRLPMNVGNLQCDMYIVRSKADRFLRSHNVGRLNRISGNLPKCRSSAVGLQGCRVVAFRISIATWASITSPCISQRLATWLSKKLCSQIISLKLHGKDVNVS